MKGIENTDFGYAGFVTFADVDRRYERGETFAAYDMRAGEDSHREHKSRESTKILR